jgi:predicted nucleotidyltransferase
MSAEELERLARAHGIRVLAQFESTLTGLVHERSDVDLAVLLDRPALSLVAYGELMHDLQSLFPGPKIDLAVMDRLFDADRAALLMEVVMAPMYGRGGVRPPHALRLTTTHPFSQLTTSSTNVGSSASQRSTAARSSARPTSSTKITPCSASRPNRSGPAG